MSGATSVFFGPTPYLSAADIPAGFYAGGTPTFLEDFEDGTLDGGITASAGAVIPPGFLGAIDSVDGDDGAIDGMSAQNGTAHSWFFGSGATGVTFTFAAPVTAAGMVWTDAGARSVVTFEAFGPGMISLGTVGPNAIADSVNSGTTAEDRFYGVQDLMGGIVAIKMSNTFGGIEVDHVQYGDAFVDGPGPSPSVPEPTTILLLGLGLVGLAFTRKRLH